MSTIFDDSLFSYSTFLAIESETLGWRKPKSCVKNNNISLLLTEFEDSEKSRILNETARPTYISSKAN